MDDRTSEASMEKPQEGGLFLMNNPWEPETAQMTYRRLG